MWTRENRGLYERKGVRYPSDLRDAEWALIAPLIPPAKRGGPARALVSTMLAEAVPQSPYLFPGDAPNKPLRDIKRFWQGVCHTAGIEGVRLHDLRHT